jgi:hypothetical protein
MRFSTTFLILANAMLTAACGGAIDGEAELEESVSTEQAALTIPFFTSSDDSWDDRFFVSWHGCPPATPYVVGLGFEGLNSGINDAYFSRTSSDQWDTIVTVRTPSRIEGLGVQAICSNAKPIRRTVTASDGDATSTCLSTEVAIGGGATCDNTDAFLYRTRPNPDVAESTPTGWRAACSQGAVTTYAMCRDKNDQFDFTDCKTERVNGTGNVTVLCDSGYQAISGGGFCGNGALEEVMTKELFGGIHAECRSSTAAIHGYAVCCRM